MSNQIVRSGTSIGANIAEAHFGASKPEFSHRMKISLREANETVYWLELLTETHYLTPESSKSLMADCKEIIYLLVRIIRSLDVDNK